MCMGPPLPRVNQCIVLWVYPHVYGATILIVFTIQKILGLSPCVWGHLPKGFCNKPSVGSIPMCMGPPILYAGAISIQRVYPHVYGATNAVKADAITGQGLSPCVRGHPPRTDRTDSG